MTKDEFYQYALDSYRPTESLLKLIPENKLEWRPGESFMTVGQLIRHLSEGIGTELRMAYTNSWPKPEEMSEAMKQEAMPVCNIKEALARLEKDKTTLRELLSEVSEEDFANRIISVPWGWKSKMEKLALDFREHFTNHKMQLFTYLKLLGFPVNTETLYMG